MKNYNSIDLTKFILSIFVITIHCYIVPTIQQPLLRDICMMIQYTAVPLFFCFTGYFLFRRVLLAPEGAKKNIKRAWLRFGKLYLIWFIIYSVIIDGQGGGDGGVCVCVCGGGGGGGKIFQNFFFGGGKLFLGFGVGFFCFCVVFFFF
ncbi:acyltransferase family protein, partial [Bacteroides uniformis]|nr:acyltransferase family protein [Bacteroides uniformis]